MTTSSLKLPSKHLAFSQIIAILLLFSLTFASRQVRTDIISSGETVLVYESSTEPKNIYFAILDTSGSRTYGPKQVNIITTADARQPCVARTSTGFAVVFEQNGGIYFQIYDSSYSELSSQKRASPDDGKTYSNPSCAQALYDEFVVTFQSNFGAEESEIYYMSFDSDGDIYKSITQVNTFTSSYQSQPRAASCNGGNYFMIIWDSYTEDTGGLEWGQYAQIYSSNSYVSQSLAFRVADSTAGQQIRGDVAGSPDSDQFVAVWRTDEPSIRAASFDSSGNKQTEWEVNTETMPDFSFDDLNDPFLYIYTTSSIHFGWREEDGVSQNIQIVETDINGNIQTNQYEAYSGGLHDFALAFPNSISSLQAITHENSEMVVWDVPFSYQRSSAETSNILLYTSGIVVQSGTGDIIYSGGDNEEDDSEEDSDEDTGSQVDVTDNDNDSDDSVNIVGIIGGTVGTIIFVVVFSVVLIAIQRARRQQNRKRASVKVKQSPREEISKQEPSYNDHTNQNMSQNQMIQQPQYYQQPYPQYYGDPNQQQYGYQNQQYYGMYPQQQPYYNQQGQYDMNGWNQQYSQGQQQQSYNIQINQ